MVVTGRKCSIAFANLAQKGGLVQAQVNQG